jgi:hypothetical protein
MLKDYFNPANELLYGEVKEPIPTNSGASLRHSVLTCQLTPRQESILNSRLWRISSISLLWLARVEMP